MNQPRVSAIAGDNEGSVQKLGAPGAGLMWGGATVGGRVKFIAAANATVGASRDPMTTIFAPLILSIRCSMVRVFLPYSFTSAKVSSLTRNQKSSIFSYSR